MVIMAEELNNKRITKEQLLCELPKEQLERIERLSGDKQEEYLDKLRKYRQLEQELEEIVTEKDDTKESDEVKAQEEVVDNKEDSEETKTEEDSKNELQEKEDNQVATTTVKRRIRIQDENGDTGWIEVDESNEDLYQEYLKKVDDMQKEMGKKQEEFTKVIDSYFTGIIGSSIYTED